MFFVYPEYNFYIVYQTFTIRITSDYADFLQYFLPVSV